LNPDLSSLSLYNSADDRDYCEYVHIHQDPDAATNPHGPIREVTVKSFSMSVHIRRPVSHLNFNLHYAAPSHLSRRRDCGHDQGMTFDLLFLPFELM
jgi:hypothetical protein